MRAPLAQPAADRWAGAHVRRPAGATAASVTCTASRPSWAAMERALRLVADAGW
ncbi:hypothetical protein ACTMTI_23470 [Nonomuraea sp. H19]|uniref:hypothetical protein n=1 Tax=Nonomuraea sp. H19 TaxID=3452206 RepID=UPI003F8C4220